MRRSMLTVVVLACLLAPSTASAAPIRECGNYGWTGNGMNWTYGKVQGAGLFNLTTRRVWCSGARPVARRAYNGYEGGRQWLWRGWRCRILIRRHEYLDTRCKKRRSGRWHVVRWQSAS